MPKTYSIVFDMTDESTDVDLAIAMRAVSTTLADALEAGDYSAPEVDREEMAFHGQIPCISAVFFRSA